MDDKEFAPNVALSRGRVRVSVSQFNGREQMDVRHVWELEGKWLPTKKGVNVPLDETPILLQAIVDAYNAATGMTLQLTEG